jgi:hypothetical protein
MVSIVVGKPAELRPASDTEVLERIKFLGRDGKADLIHGHVGHRIKFDNAAATSLGFRHDFFVGKQPDSTKEAIKVYELVGAFQRMVCGVDR